MQGVPVPVRFAHQRRPNTNFKHSG
ncbi:hypothetical protein GMOD_00005903 [Pyrenophora seminiperda CCB06]|uniref:Uncharacterized protein n=1 Tax=Pyrenophora seminiperda CCB06 TaxID=1302712 RepID=A0A3M7MAE7_9PLEO|nr:hypothetical protein GMOD_00005903 [Pyrenophora seminiperda CCB06]